MSIMYIYIYIISLAGLTVMQYSSYWMDQEMLPKKESYFYLWDTWYCNPNLLV